MSSKVDLRSPALDRKGNHAFVEPYQGRDCALKWVAVDAPLMPHRLVMVDKKIKLKVGAKLSGEG